MREIRQRAPAPVRFAESKIRAELQWHYLRNIAPHTIVDVEECNGILRRIESAGPCDPSGMHVLAIDPIFSSNDPRKCRLLSIALFDGAGERTLTGTEEEILRAFQSYLDASDPDVLALFDADSEKLPLLGLRAGELSHEHCGWEGCPGPQSSTSPVSTQGAYRTGGRRRCVRRGASSWTCGRTRVRTPTSSART